MKGGVWTTDWFVGAAMTAAILALAQYGFFSPLEQAAYDWGVRLSAPTPTDRVAIIAIDDTSLERIGQWPWPRSRYADLLKTLEPAAPRSIAFVPLFLDPQSDPGADIVADLLDFIGRSSLPSLHAEMVELGTHLEALEDRLGTQGPEELTGLRRFLNESSLGGAAAADAGALLTYLQQMRQYLDADTRLANRIQSNGNVLLAMEFRDTSSAAGTRGLLPEHVTRMALATTPAAPPPPLSGPPAPTMRELAVPFAQLGQVSAGIGHVSGTPWRIEEVQQEPLAVAWGERYYPSLALLLALRELGLTPADVVVEPGHGLRAGHHRFQTGPDLAVHPAYYGAGTIETHSFADVLTGKVPAERFRDRTVLIGATTARLGQPAPTAVDPDMPLVTRTAHLVSNLVQQQYNTRPAWGYWLALAAYALIGAYLILLLPRLRAAVATLLTLGLMLGLLGVQTWLLAGLSLWVPFSLAVILLLLGHLAIESKRVLLAHRYTTQRELFAERSRLDGLALQGKGKLDQAFARLREVPLDDGLMEVLYNLGADFERRGQYDRARAVYEYMTGYDSDFRDLQQRMIHTKAMQGAGAPTHRMSKSGRFLIAEGEDRPMLGRYEVLKEIGKGAMGTVYLGQDPKISRTVAIKTLDLSQDFDKKEIEDVKARFFREAETAGRLNHPSIVTIYDAGEAHQLAYIAMEFLEGENLGPYTRGDNLLPLTAVLDIIARCADTLAYAHANSVIHRDIKPANIMYRPETGDIKITDFGIARVAGASRTRSGMVLGTPSYMSPEQLSGKRVDGRSDLFSLGVMCFQLVTGRLPFIADSMANLMYKIANEAHPSVRVLRPDVPDCIAPIIDRAMQKDRDDRYATGTEMAQDIRNCLKTLQ